MSVRIDGDIVRLEGLCPVEDAEPLAAALEAKTVRAVDVSTCRHLHGAVVQALLVFAASIQGDPADDFLRAHIVPALTRDGGAGNV